MLLAIEAILYVVIPVVVLTQIIWPLVWGRPVFPAFRRRRLVKEQADLLEQLDQAEINARNQALYDTLHPKESQHNEPTQPTTVADQPASKPRA